MSRLGVVDLGDSTHSGPEDHGHVRVQCHPGDGLADSLLWTLTRSACRRNSLLNERENVG